MILLFDPEHKPSSKKYTTNIHGIQFMELDDEYSNLYWSVKSKFYEKLDLLLRRMKSNKISYWK